MMDAGNRAEDRWENEKDTASIAHYDRKKPLRASLFEPNSVAQLQTEYKKSQPYQHLVIPHLMNEEVLQGACEELKTNMQATLKETDIFKVYQTGDLANMDGLPEESKRLLPSLFAIRDGLYSLEFRRLVQSLTSSGPLSGEQIDLSVNAFGHTGHLLCHDDVIGTRKVSYILYLVAKDWGLGEKPDGGGLQLYPLEKEGVPGIPAYAPSKTIPPRWNQMVLFAVQPGRSFHDVQEVYSEDKPRLAVSGWFHAARASEIKDWPTIAVDAFASGEVGAATSTLQQLIDGAGVEAAGIEDDGAPGAFSADFVGEAEGMEELAEWVNPEYLSPPMMDQCAAAFYDNGSTIQLHRFLKEEVAKKIVEAAIAADKLDGLGYMEASRFDAGVRGRWRKAGPPHRQRMLRLSMSAAGEEPGDGESPTDDEIGTLLRELRDKLFASKAVKALLEKLLGGASVVASRRQARRFRPGLDYTLATPGVSWKWESRPRRNTHATDSGAEKNGARSGSSQGGGGKSGNGVACGDNEDKTNEEEEEERDFMVLDATLCFVDDREPYKEAAWRQDEVGGYVTYLGGEEEDGDDEDGGEDDDTADGGGFGSGSTSIRNGAAHNGRKAAGNGPSSGGSGESKNDAAVYRADEGGSLVSVSAASNALSLVLRDDANITSFVKYVSSAAPGSRFDVAGEYLVIGAGGGDGDNSDEEGVSRGVLLETVPEGDSEDDKEVEEERQESARKKLKTL